MLNGQPETWQFADGDLVFVQNGSMTDTSSLGSMQAAPPKLKKARNGSWALWEKLAEGRPAFGRPAAFNSCVAQSDWASFTVTLKDPAFFDTPRAAGDRPLPVPPGTRNFAFISQFVEIALDTVFTVKFSVRAAQKRCTS